jgi:hypothetical protein
MAHPDGLIRHDHAAGEPQLFDIPVAQANSIIEPHAVAKQSGWTLISLDNEHLTRLGSIIMVRTPATVLAELVPPTSPASAV